METVEAQTRQKSERKKVEEQLALYGQIAKEIKQGQSALKEIEMELLEAAEKNPEWFNGGKTANFENGQLKWVASSSVDIPEDFDMSKFSKKYPNLVKIKTTESFVIAKLRTYLEDPKLGTVITEMGVSIKTHDNFKVEPA